MPDELEVIKAENMTDQTAQTGGLPRLAGVGTETTSVESLWMGRATGKPGEDSEPHHHGEAETAGYILSGETRIFFGENYQKHVDLSRGDFIYVPPYVPHVERNVNDDEPVEFLTARTPANITVNLSDDPDIPPR